MDNYITGSMIRPHREKKQLTQQQLADRLGVSSKTVSKWETARGLPDISLLLPLADLLICSEEFILKLTGISDAEEAVRRVYAKYRPKVCGATMGVRGSMCYDGKDFVRCPAFPVEKVVDTTGCGDLFHTGFAVRYLETRDLMECQRFGAAVSAVKCRGLSGRPPSAPTRAEVESFLADRI